MNLQLIDENNKLLLINKILLIIVLEFTPYFEKTGSCIATHVYKKGRFQTLIRRSVKLSNFENLFWPCDSTRKFTTTQRFSASNT